MYTLERFLKENGAGYGLSGDTPAQLDDGGREMLLEVLLPPIHKFLFLLHVSLCCVWTGHAVANMCHDKKKWAHIAGVHSMQLRWHGMKQIRVFMVHIDADAELMAPTSSRNPSRTHVT
jgi:hypothetical protein